MQNRGKLEKKIARNDKSSINKVTKQTQKNNRQKI